MPEVLGFSLSPGVHAAWAASYSLWGAAAFTLILAVLLARGRKAYRSLAPLRPLSHAPGSLPDCMVVIPARNEESNIERAVRSLPADTVIVVDDHSTDRTAAVAREAGAGVLSAPPLPRNALGKPNACSFGAAALRSRWILFTDADTWFEPGFLNAAIACAEAGGLSMLSVQLQPECRGLIENVFVPYVQALAYTGASMISEPHAFFRGQCLLVQREPYGFVGGHAAVATQISEDVKLRMLGERHRLKIATVRAAGLGHVRLYQGYSGIRSGIERHAFRFMSIGATSGVVILLTAFLAALWLPVLAWLLWDQQLAAACVFALIPAALLLAWYPRKLAALLAPFAFYFLLPALLIGALAAFFGRPISWKGRIIRTVA